MSSQAVLKSSILSHFEEESPAIPPLLSFSPTEILSIPDFRVVHDNDTDSVSIKTESEHFPSSKFERKITNLTKFNHDFVFEPYSEVTDTSFGSTLISTGGHDDNLTPDMIFTVNDMVAIVEFTTLQESNERTMRHAFDKKLFAYREAVERRILAFPDLRIKLFIIVVGTDSVVTNIFLPIEEINLLTLRLRCAKDLKVTLKNMDLDVDFEREELKARQKSTRLAFQTVSTPSKFNEWFSRELWEGEGSMSNQKNFQELLQDAMSEAKKTHDDLCCKVSDNYTYDQCLEENKARFGKARYEFITSQSDKATHERMTTKSVVNTPFFDAVESEFQSTSLVGSSFAYENVHSYKFTEDSFMQLWTRAHDGILYQDIFRAEESDNMSEDMFLDLFKEMPVASSPLTSEEEKIIKKNKRLYKRFFAKSIPDSVRKSLALDGVQAKMMKNDVDVKAKESFNKKSLNYNCRITSIEDMIDWGYLATTGEVETKTERPELELIEHGYKSHDNNLSSHLLQFSKELQRTKAGRHFAICSDVGQELATSLRQNCPPDCFILKKLRRYEVYLLIKPTRSSGHIFVSFCWKPSRIDQDVDLTDPFYSSQKPTHMTSSWKDPNAMLRHSNCFRPVEKHGDFYYSPFVSFKQHKLTNLLHAESMFIASMFHSFEMNEIPPSHYSPILSKTRDNTYEKNAIARAWQQSFFMMLMHQHDKTAAEEIMTLSRYVCMEGFVSYPRVPKPYKMLEKMSGKVTSVLQLIIMKRLIKTMELICDRRFEIELNQDRMVEQLTQNIQPEPKYLHLFDPIFHKPLFYPDQLISYFYIGYFKNKNESPESNSSYQLLTKILELEDKMPETNVGLGLSDKPLKDLGYHEFHRTFLNQICSTGQKILQKKLGANYKEILETQILSSLSEVDLEDLATLKATSNFGPGMQFSSSVKHYRRSKLIEKVSSLSEKGLKLFDLFKPCLEKLENDDDSLYIDIFKKAQHGGLREIYVLSLESRVVQLVIERISRAICMNFDSETMTHPKNKHELQRAHHRKCRQEFGRTTHLTTSSSDDASKWSQGHFVTKFFIMLREFTPKYMHSFLWRSLKLWTSKKIMIPEDVLMLIDRNEPPNLEQPFFSDLVDGHHGQREVRWKEPSTSFIKTRSGMMQGILHYTSSLFHTLYLEWFKRLVEREIKRTRFSTPKVDCLVTVMQSSDDSSILISFTTTNAQDKVLGLTHASLLLELKHVLGRALGIYKSVKCTQNTLNVMEFNSEYFFCSSLFRPTVRWIAASLILSENESLGARQEEMANSLTAILEGGGALMTCAGVQIAQALLHYRTFGSSLNSAFFQFARMVLKMPDPALGFFLMDNPCAAGISGFKYNLLKTLQTNNLLSIKFKKMLSGSETVSVRAENEYLMPLISEPTSSGTLLQSTTVLFGDRKKWRSLIERSSLPLDWEDSIEKSHGKILFQRAQSVDEALVKISAKAHSPGVVSSLSRGNDITRIIASAVYLLQDQVVRIGSQWLNMEECFSARVSLSSLLMHEIHESRKFGVSLSDEDFSYLFPNYEEYKVLDSRLKRFQFKTMFIKRSIRKKVKTEVEVIETQQNTIVPLEVLCRYKWYNIGEPAYASRVIDNDWKKYCHVLPWLASDAQTTLENSPFNTYMQLANFLSRQRIKGRTIHLSASPVYSFQGSTNVSSLISSDLFPGWSLTRDVPSEIASDLSQMPKRMMQHVISMLMTLPASMALKYCYYFLESCDQMDVVSINSRLYGLYSVQKFIKTSKTLEQEISECSLREKKKRRNAFWHDFISDNIYRGRGCVGIFTRRQQFDTSTKTYSGLAIYKGCIDGRSIEMGFYTMPGSKFSTLLFLKIDKKINLDNIIGALRGLFEDLRIQNIPIKPDVLSQMLSSLSSHQRDEFNTCQEGLIGLRPTVKDRMTAAYIEEPSMTFILEKRHIKSAGVRVEGGQVKVVASFTDDFFSDNLIEAESISANNKLAQLKEECRETAKKLAQTPKTSSRMYEDLMIRERYLRAQYEDARAEVFNYLRIAVISYRPKPSDADETLAKDFTIPDSSTRIHAGIDLRMSGRVIIHDFVTWRSTKSDLYALTKGLMSQVRKEEGDKYEMIFKMDNITFLQERLRDGFRREGVNLTRMQAYGPDLAVKMSELSMEEIDNELFGAESEYLMFTTGGDSSSGEGSDDDEQGHSSSDAISSGSSGYQMGGDPIWQFPRSHGFDTSSMVPDVAQELIETIDPLEMEEISRLITDQFFPTEVNEGPSRFNAIITHPLATDTVTVLINQFGFNKLVQFFATRECSEREMAAFKELVEVLNLEDKEVKPFSPQRLRKLESEVLVQISESDAF